MQTKSYSFRTFWLSVACLVLIGLSLLAAQRTQRWMKANDITPSSSLAPPGALTRKAVNPAPVVPTHPAAQATPIAQATPTTAPAPEASTFAEVAPVIIAGGGGRQAGGSYVITGAIGQVGLGAAKKQGFSLDSGFWPAESGNQPGNCAAITIAPVELPDATVGIAYLQSLTVSPSGTYTFSLTAGSLLAGLTLNAQNGVISGIPTLNENVKFTVKVTASNGCTALREYKLKTKTAALAAITSTTTMTHDESVNMVRATRAIADFDGDGKTDFALWRSQLGAWVILKSGEQQFDDNANLLGRARQRDEVLRLFDVPTPTTALQSTITVVADFDGDGKSDAATFRPADGHWMIRQSGTGQTIEQEFGVAHDVPVPGDYDGDGKADLAVWRPHSGTWQWQRSSDGQMQSEAMGATAENAVPVPADYDGDGKMDFALLRRNNSGTANWCIKRSSDGQVMEQAWGHSHDLAVPGDYDGDGKADLSVWNGDTGEWKILRSSNGLPMSKNWGATALGLDIGGMSVASLGQSFANFGLPAELFKGDSFGPKFAPGFKATKGWPPAAGAGGLWNELSILIAPDGGFSLILTASG